MRSQVLASIGVDSRPKGGTNPVAAEASLGPPTSEVTARVRPFGGRYVVRSRALSGGC
jgi:hypothetical protein